MGQMTTPKPLINIIRTCQEMMVWTSMELIGSMDVVRSKISAQKMGKSRLIFVKPPTQI
jgi:hypothetical protein